MFLLIALVVASACDDSPEPPSAEKQFKEDLEFIDGYLAAHGLSAMKDPRGIRFTIHTLGQGSLLAQPHHTVTVAFVGYTFDGSIFEEGTVEKPLEDFIDGLQIGLGIIPEGTKATLYIPSLLGYADKTYKFLPPNTNLKYEVELLDIKRTLAEEEQLVKDVQAIDQYLAANNIVAEKDPSGLRYVISQAGDGILPWWYSTVKLSYTGRLQSSSTSFFSGTSEPGTRVVDYVSGFQIGLQKMGKGGKATFYIPSVLAFGSKGAGNGIVPANTNVVYEVELIDVID
jgi:FKBP-type peptidyl-prolyl cis-trans isomerase FkpA